MHRRTDATQSAKPFDIAMSTRHAGESNNPSPYEGAGARDHETTNSESLSASQDAAAVAAAFAAETAGMLGTEQSQPPSSPSRRRSSSMDHVVDSVKKGAPPALSAVMLAMMGMSRARKQSGRPRASSAIQPPSPSARLSAQGRSRAGSMGGTQHATADRASRPHGRSRSSSLKPVLELPLPRSVAGSSQMESNATANAFDIAITGTVEQQRGSSPPSWPSIARLLTANARPKGTETSWPSLAAVLSTGDGHRNKNVDGGRSPGVGTIELGIHDDDAEWIPVNDSDGDSGSVTPPLHANYDRLRRRTSAPAHVSLTAHLSREHARLHNSSEGEVGHNRSLAENEAGGLTVERSNSQPSLATSLARQPAPVLHQRSQSMFRSQHATTPVKGVKGSTASGSQLPNSSSSANPSSPTVFRSQSEEATSPAWSRRGSSKSSHKQRKSFRKSMQEVGDFLRMGHGRLKSSSANFDSADDDDDGAGPGNAEAAEDVWRSKMGWGPRLDMDAVEYESKLLNLDRASSQLSAASGEDEEEEADEKDPLAVPLDARQRILAGFSHSGIQVAEFIVCLFLLWGTGIYMLAGQPGRSGVVYMGFCIVAMCVLLVQSILTCYAKPKYTFKTSSLLNLITIVALAWEVAWLQIDNSLSEAAIEGLVSFQGSCGLLLDGSSAFKAGHASGSVAPNTLPWAWFGSLITDCSAVNASASAWKIGDSIDGAWNHESILTFSSRPLRFLTAIQLLKLAFLNTFNHWFEACARHRRSSRARPLVPQSKLAGSGRSRGTSIDGDTHSVGRRGVGGLSSPRSSNGSFVAQHRVSHLGDDVNRSAGGVSRGISPATSPHPHRRKGSERPAISSTESNSSLPKTGRPRRSFVLRMDSRGSDMSFGGESVTTSVGLGHAAATVGRAKLYRRSDTIGNKLTQVFMSKAALGYMCIIVMTSYLYRPECVPDASIITDLSVIQSLADDVVDFEGKWDTFDATLSAVDSQTAWCNSTSSCCVDNKLCTGALAQLAFGKQSTLALLIFPGGGVAYNRTRDAESLGFEVSPFATDSCRLERLNCGGECNSGASGLIEATFIHSVACPDLRTFEYWTVAVPSIAVPGEFYVAIVDKSDIIDVDHAYNMYLDIFVLLVFISGTLLMNCSMQSFAYKLSSPLKRLAVEMRRVSNLDFSSSSRSRTTAMVPSKYFEIFAIQLQFLRMQGALKSFAKFMPESVVQLHFQRMNNGAGTNPAGSQLSLSATSAQVDLKAVTILFSDIKSFTSLCESIQPEDMCLLLNEYFEAMCAIVSHRGGTVIEFIGDAMLVVWNIPLPVANHAERCVLFAMEAQQELRDLRQIWLDRGLPRVEVRMGVHTGLVYAGILGSAARFKYGLLGESLNVASYLEEANKRYGTNVLVSAGTVAHIKMFQDHAAAVKAAMNATSDYFRSSSPNGVERDCDEPRQPSVNSRRIGRRLVSPSDVDFETPGKRDTVGSSSASNEARDHTLRSSPSHSMLSWLNSDGDLEAGRSVAASNRNNDSLGSITDSETTVTASFRDDDTESFVSVAPTLVTAVTQNGGHEKHKEISVKNPRPSFATVSTSSADFEGGSNSDGKCVPVESDRAMHSSDVEKRSSTLLAAGTTPTKQKKSSYDKPASRSRRYPQCISTEIAVFRCVDFVIPLISGASVEPIFEAMPHNRVNILAAAIHQEAICRYLDRRFGKAIALLDQEAEILPQDEVVKLLRARCEQFVLIPPPEVWNGEAPTQQRLPHTPATSPQQSQVENRKSPSPLNNNGK